MPSKISVDQIAHSNETNALEIDTSGNVTIQQDLKFAGNAAIKDSAGNNVISESAGVVTVNADAAVISGSSTGDLVRITQTGTGNALVVEDETNPDSTPFVVDASGNVGIGTSSPAQLLHLKTNSTGSTRLRLENSEGNAEICTDGTDGFLTAGGTEILRFESDGDVGIGTSSPDSKIHSVSTTGGANSVNFQNTNSGGYGAKFVGGGGASNLYIVDFRDYSGASKLKIDGSGNVGIGTDNPNGKLQINSGSTSLFRVTDSAIDGSNFNSRITKTSGNANDFKTPGFYRFDPAVSNTPSSSYHFAVIVFGNGNNVTSQIAVRIASTISYVRSFNTSWTSWARLDT